MAARKKSVRKTERAGTLNTKQRRTILFSIWINTIHRALEEQGIVVAERKMNTLIREMYERDDGLTQRSKEAIERDFREYFSGIKKGILGKK